MRNLLVNWLDELCEEEIQLCQGISNNYGAVRDDDIYEERDRGFGSNNESLIQDN